MFHVLFPVTLAWEALLSFISHATHPWHNLFWFCFGVYLMLWGGIGYFSMKILMLPIQIYDAMQREDMLKYILLSHSSPLFEEAAQVKETQKLHIESKWRNRELGCELEQVMADCKQFKDPLEEVETEKKAILKKYQLLQLRILELEEENDTPRAQEERMLKSIHEGKRIFLHRETWRATFFLRGMRMIWIMSSLWSSTRETWPQPLKQKSAAHHVEKQSR